MNSFKFNSSEYLERINLDTEINPDLDCLKKIHRAQHRAIPFENFDIALGRKIDLSPETVFTKAGQKRVLQIMCQFGHPSPIGGESVIKRAQLRTTEL